MSQKACERYICHVMAYAYLFEMPQNRIIYFSVFLLFEISSRVNYLKCPIFICSKYLKCPIFPIWFWKREKWGISNISNIEKWGISDFSHVIILKTEKEPKMKLFDFGAFQINGANVITWQNHLSQAFWGISYYPP